MLTNQTIGRCSIVWNREYQEWTVKAWTLKNERYQDADYFAADKLDAQETAVAMLERHIPAGYELRSERGISYWIAPIEEKRVKLHMTRFENNGTVYQSYVQDFDSNSVIWESPMSFDKKKTFGAALDYALDHDYAIVGLTRRVES